VREWNGSSAVVRAGRGKILLPLFGREAWPSIERVEFLATRLDRLARSALHLCQIAAELACKQVHLQVLGQHRDTSDPTGRMLFHMLGAIAQFETELRAERQMDGIQKARSRGVHLGRKKRLTRQQRAELRYQRAQGVLISTLMREYHLSKASVYRYLRDLDAVPSP
jgi:DNA invertase Pin-like site-specific DNA recombinase